MKSTFILAFVCGCLLPSSSRAMDLKQAKFTQVVNKVEVISAADKSLRKISVSDTFKMPDTLRTGTDSRTELVAEDGTVTRVGANTIFSYDTANRTIDLQQGSILFHSPHGKGGGSIRTKSATASVIGTTIIVTCTPDGGFKLLDLEGETEVRFLNGLKQHLGPGQMTFILPGGTQPSPIIIFRLDEQIKGSLLVNGFDHPLPSIARIDTEITQQLLEILNNQLGDTGLLVGDRATPDSVQVFQEIEAANARQNYKQGNDRVPIVVPTVPIDSGNNSGEVTVTAGGDVDISNGTLDSFGGGDITVGIDNPITTGDIAINNLFLANYFGYIDIESTGNIDVEDSEIESRDFVLMNAPNGLATLNGDTITAVNNSVVSAGIGISVSGTSIAADPVIGTISLNNASGMTTINNGSSMQAFYISVNSPDGILLDASGGTYSGYQLDMTSGNASGTDKIDVQNADLTAFATVNMSAHTINLLNVAFGGSSTVNLHSFFGLLADNPNTGAVSLPGYVNFINGVTYGGDPAEIHVNPVSGPGIYISTLR